MNDKSDINLGNLIRSKRELLKITQQQIADYVGVSKSAVSRWESGDIGNMGIEKVPKLSSILEISPLDLINLDKDSSHKRVSTDFNTRSIPLLGTIAAGLPILAEENIEDYFNIDCKVKADFALKVKGDSMINAGIQEQDIVFIKKQCALENGEIGAILIEGEATLKKFYKNDGVVILQAENKGYEPIVLTNGDVRILGKLIAVLSMR